MAVVNHRGAITYLSSRWPGSVADSRVLQESFLQDVLDCNLLGEYYLIGDAGYHLAKESIDTICKIRCHDTPKISTTTNVCPKHGLRWNNVFGMLKEEISLPCN